MTEEARLRPPEEALRFELEELEESVAEMMAEHKVSLARDRARVEASGGVYCVVIGCWRRRTSAGQRQGYKRVCDAHDRGRRGVRKYIDGVWRSWDRIR